MNDKEFNNINWGLIIFGFLTLLSCVIIANAWRHAIDEQVAFKRKKLESKTETHRYMIDSDFSDNLYFVDTMEGKVWKKYKDPETDLTWWGKMEFGEVKKERK